MKQIRTLLGRSACLLAKSLGFLLVVAACAGIAKATPPATPEVDPAFAGNAIALVVGGMLLLTGLRRKR